MTSLSDGLVPLLPRLRPFAWSLIRDWPDADDLLQTSCARALSKADQWQGGTRLDAWIYRLMPNIWIDETRKRSIRIGQDQKDAAESGELQTSSDSEKTADAGQVLQQIALLQKEFSTVLLLVAVEWYSYAETPDTLEIPIGTVMSRLPSARVKLRAALADQKGARR